MESVTNEVLAERLEGFKNLVVDKLDSIEKQTMKTNGRTTKSEENIDIINAKLNKILGGLIVFNIVLGVVVSFTLSLI